MFPIALRSRQSSLLLLALLLAALALSSPLLGQAPTESAAPASPQSSLDLVPAGAAFYLATSSHKQLWQAVTDSQAYASLKESPAGRKMRKAYRKGLSRGWDQFGENPLRYYLEGYAKSLDSVEGKLVLPYLERLLGNEVFLYADAQTVPFLSAFSAYYTELNTALMESAEGEDLDAWELIRQAGERHFRKLTVPTIVLGAIADEPEVFVGFLELMQTGFQQVIAQDPEGMRILADAMRFHSATTATGEPLAWFGFEIASDDLPWDELTLIDPDLGPVLEAIRPLYAGKRFALAFAVNGRTVMLTLGPSLEHISQLGTGPLLIDQPLLKPLQAARSGAHPLCWASFQSAEFARLSQSTWQDLAEGASNLMSQILVETESELLSPQELRDLAAAFRMEAEQFASEMQAFETPAAASLGFATLTPEGLEGFSYQFDQPTENTASEPLQLSRQLTTLPLLATFTRDQSTAQQWQVLGKYSSKFFAAVEEVAPLLAEDLEQAEGSAIILEQLVPLVRGLTETTFNQLMPQMAGEEWGLVVDLSVARNSWHTAMPPASQPLPMPGIVLLMSLKDAATMKQVGAEYLALARQALEGVKELGGGEVPESLEIPSPDRTNLPGGERYSFSLPADLGLSSDWLPHALLSERLLALGYFPEQTTRWLEAVEQNSSDSLAAAVQLFGPAATPNPSLGLTLFDNRQLADALQAWTNYGLEQAESAGLPIALSIPAETSDLKMSETEVRETLAAAFDFYRCFRGLSTRTYTEGNTRIQHFLLPFSDLK